MITEVRAPTRERILDAALELFGTKGYAGTSVGDIERAAGLSPRSGALYKHFPSKRDLLFETVRRRGKQVGQVTQVVDAQMLGNARAELHVMGRMLMQEIANDLPALRIVMRESDNFPELRDEFYERIVRSGHGQAVRWLRLLAQRAGVSESDLDLEAIAVLLLGPIVEYRIIEAILGRPPLDVEEPRFLAVWERSALALLATHGLVPDQETQT
jgi:AcrR family transcriptional regulator